MSVIAQVLEKAGFQTFLPQRDGLEAIVMKFASMPFSQGASPIRTLIDEAIFSLDVFELIQQCDAVVCNLNGRVPDEGMIVEASLAYSVDKPLVLYKEDFRAPFAGVDNAMLTSLVKGKLVSDLKQLPAAVQQVLNRPKKEPTPLSHNLASTVQKGERIAKVVARLLGDTKDTSMPDLVAAIVDPMIRE